ncbi:MAG: hypothetical protein OXE17_15970 [Chloroflexi bacterium]|nr:hypothetical protein [Chloroflexota bacterium]
MLMNHDDYAKERALRDPEFASAVKKRAVGLLEGNEEDRRIAFRILQNQLGLTEAQIEELDNNKATA